MSTGTQTRKKIQIKKTPQYCNILYNNDKTPMDIVIVVLCKVFKKTIPQAHDITMKIHTEEKGIAFVGSKEVFEFKQLALNRELTKLHEHNLKHNVEVFNETD